MDKKIILKNKIEKLSKNYQMEIIKIIVFEKKYFFTFDKNNGFFVDIKYFTNEFVDKLLNYIEFIEKTDFEIKDPEIILPSENNIINDNDNNKTKSIIKKQVVEEAEDEDDNLELKKQTTKYFGIKNKILKNL